MEEAIFIEEQPRLDHPVLIAGFDGWGNALDISKSMVSYMIGKLGAGYFARFNPDLFHRFDENRPIVNIENGVLKDIKPPGGFIYGAHSENNRDVVLLNANEPSLRWSQYVEELLSFSRNLGVDLIITIGSMYDNVLHTDRIISAITSEKALLSRLQERDVSPINYQGPSAIHSSIHREAREQGFQSVSLWCHCPYYLQGTTHFGLLSTLGSLLSSLGEFELDVSELENRWKELNRQIKDLVSKNPEFQDMINNLRKAKVRGSWTHMKEDAKKNQKIIDLRDFFKPN